MAPICRSVTSDEGIELWLARGLALRAPKLEAEEFVEVFALPLAEAQEMVRDGRITDAKTVAGLLWLKAFPLQPQTPA